MLTQEMHERAERMAGERTKLISYVKAFTKNKGWTEFDLRRAKKKIKIQGMQHSYYQKMKYQIYYLERMLER